MAHATPGRRRAAGNEADHRLLAPALGLVLEELRCVFLGRSADLADHDDRPGCFISKKHLQHGDEVRALDRVAADAYRGGLAEPLVTGLEYSLVGEGARTRNNADRALLEDVARHDADLALSCRHDSRTIRA